MPYTSGETPEMGDHVKNKWEQPGTVIAVHVERGGREQVSVRWDDGGVDLPLTSAAEFTLLSRSSAATEGQDSPAASSRSSQVEERALQEDLVVCRPAHVIKYGVVPPATAKTMPGLQLLTAIMDGTLPAPPIQQALDLRLGSGSARGPLEVVLSSAGTRIEGTVTDENDLPSAGAVVALVPEAEQRKQFRRYKDTTTDQYGQFILRGVAPGTYKLFSWKEVENNAWEDPEFLAPFESQGAKVAAEENGHIAIRLKSIPTEKPKQ